jgi:tRNA pseudouridine13 synthase
VTWLIVSGSLEKDSLAKHIYDGLLAGDSVTHADFRDATKHFFADGCYRRAIVVPGDFQWKLTHFEGKDQEIQTAYVLDEEDNAGQANGHYRGLSLKFSLPKSSYATMLIREVSRMPTTFEHQCSLNSLYK